MEKEKYPIERPKPAAVGEPDGGSLNAIRESMDRLLSAGDTLVENALSGDSAAFVKQSEQRGGE